MTDEQRPIAVIVDVYTCSEYLLAGFQALGVDVVQVRSRPEVEPAIPGMPYLTTLTGADPAVLAEQLASYAPIAVVAGQEPDVPLADALSERLGLTSNGSTLSNARRDKFEMIEALRRAGVRCADQFKSDSADEIVAWAERVGRYPVVVKPLASAATDGVAICGDVTEVRKAAEAVLGTDTIFDTHNDEVLVQSYLSGTEYVVDMVSREGQRYTCGVWEYRKRLRGVHNIYDTEVLLPPGEHPVPELIAYVDSALAALGIDHGPTHAEVIVTEDGPTLVEVGARTAGHLHPGFHDQCLTANQADLTALAYIRPQEFLDGYAGRHYTKAREAWVYSTPTELEGIVDHWAEDVLAEIKGLDSVYWMQLKAQPGGRIRPTINLKTSTMKICMLGATQEDLRRDYRRIQQIKDDVFQLR